MQRRTLLRRSAALGAIALAGCSGDGDSGGNGQGADTPQPDAVTGFGDFGVETTATGCLDDDGGSASVAFQGSPLRVDVTGTIEAPTPCYEAALEGIKYDPDEDLLKVTISATEDDSGGACAECIGGIEYEATFELEGGLPGTVLVKHGKGNQATEIARVSQSE